jgi:hypothetical protein
MGWGGMLTFKWHWSVEHRPLIQIGNRWSAGFTRKLPKKEALVTWWPTPQNWSKGSGNRCGAEPNCAAIIQRNLQPWAICSMVEVVFRTSKNRRATLHRQFQWEIHAHALKTTRRLSAPFPTSYIYIYQKPRSTLISTNVAPVPGRHHLVVSKLNDFQVSRLPGISHMEILWPYKYCWFRFRRHKIS